MKITMAKVAALRPCSSRFDNFKHNYPDFKGTLSEFLALDNITYSDKVWVSTRLLSKNQLVYWSIACAESVQHNYSAKYPNDTSLDKLFKYLKSGLDFEKLSDTEREKILVLKRDVDAASSAALSAESAESALSAESARSARSAALYAASSARSASSAESAALYAAWSAASSAESAESAESARSAASSAAEEEQNNLNLLLLASLEVE